MLNTGVRYILLSTVMFSFIQVSVKLLKDIPPQEIVIFRSFISFFACLYFINRKKIPFFGNNKKLLLARGFVGAIALFAYFYTIQQMPLATAISIHYLSPMFTIILAAFILKEAAAKKQWYCFVIAFAALLMIKGLDYRVNYIDLGIGVISATMAGLAYNIIRKLKNIEDPLVVILYFPMVTIPIFLPYTIATWVWPKSWEWLVLILVGIMTQIAQYALTRAYQIEKASNIAIYNYLGVIYAILWGSFFFNEKLQIITVVGIVILLGSTFLSTRFSKKPCNKIESPE